MAGLLDTLNLGSRSLTTYRQAIDTAGHNLANVHTPGYTRQRVAIEAVATANDPLGETGAGAEVVRIVRLHNEFLGRQIQAENSLTGSLESKEETLRQALTSLSETLSTDPGAIGTGIGPALTDFFTALQSLSASPASIPERQNFLQKAQLLATRFNQTSARLDSAAARVNGKLEAGAAKANALLSEIASLNQSIATQEGSTGASANTLRDSRQSKLEELAGIVKLEATEMENGAVNVTIGGRALVDGVALSGTLEAFDPGDGRLLIGVAGEGAELPLEGGSLQGIISVRDGELRTLTGNIHSLASLLISEVNQVHAAGFGLDGSTGADFFTGTDAGDIAVNQQLLQNPDQFQGAGAPNAAGDNRVILGLAQLANKTHASLDGATFSDRHIQTVAWLGQELANTSSALEDQKVVQDFLSQQRGAISGVSIDEEMASLVIFQKAFQASAKLITLTDELLATLIGM